MLRPFLVVACLAFAACSTPTDPPSTIRSAPSQRVSSALIGYGVRESQAVCMGDRLQQRLTISQLQRIGQIGKAGRNDRGRVSAVQVAAALNRPGDEALVAEVLRAGVGCLV